MLEVADWVAHLPRESAVAQALDPTAVHTHHLELLRRIELGQRVLAWRQTQDGHHGRNPPQPYRFPWEPAPTVWDFDVLEWDEAAEKLGGDPRLAALMARL